jgi:O-glycosyl hydrolase
LPLALVVAAVLAGGLVFLLARDQGSTPQPATITVTALRGQQIEGWGTSVFSADNSDPIVTGSGLSPHQLAQLDREIFSNAGINLVRVFAPPGPPGGSQPAVWSSSDPIFRFMRRVRPLGVRFLLTGGGAPLSMREGQSPTGALLPGQEQAYARLLARDLEVAAAAGAPFDWAAAGNEPDNPGKFWVAMLPDQAARVYGELARQVRFGKLSTRLVLGDTLGWDGARRYADAALKAPGVRSLASAVATHDYSGLDRPTQRALSGFATQNRLQLWMTEWVTGCTDAAFAPETQLGLALEWARRIALDLNRGNVQAWFMLQAVAPPFHGASCGIAVRLYGHPAQPYFLNKRYSMLRQFTDVAPPGAYRYDVRVDSNVLSAVAFRHSRTEALVVINPSARVQRARLNLGTAPGELAVRRTSATENFAPVSTRAYDGDPFPQRMAPHSVTTFTLVSP